MGTDIHISPEIFRNDRWERIMDEALVREISDFQDYAVFAVLANVRNHRFASADFRTGGGYEPISERRGFPQDMSLESRRYFAFDVPEEEMFGFEFHSPTWLRLDEIFDYDWSKVTWHTGIFAESEWETYLAQGQPNEWFRDVSGRRRVKLTTEQMRALKDGTYPREPAKEYYCEAKWPTTYWEDCGWYVTRLKEQFAPYGEPWRIRIIIAFDS